VTLETEPGDPGPDLGPIPTELRESQAERLAKAWETPKGWRYWSAVNNTEIGVWYAAAAFVFMLFGGVLALLMRLQLAFPESGLLSADLYNQVFTLHGTVMMFLFAVPVVEAFAIYVMPNMLAARDLPFPRLSAFGFWCFVLGGVFVCGSIFFDAAPKGGWFMYPPLSTTGQPGVGNDIWLLGLSFIEIASIAAAVELIVGVLKCRAPGMRINLIPLYCWYILVVAVMILFAFPPLIAGDIMLELERAFDWPFFDASRGGDPILWQHLFWIFGHPEVYIVFLPSIALVAMMVPTFARTPIVGYTWIVLAAIGTGFLSFGLWVHHMFTIGLPAISLGLFSAASQAVAIPTGVQIFCFLATLLAGKVTRAVPLLFVFGGFATFVLGGLTGVMVALAPFDFQAHDTYFVVAHLHSVLIGGVVFPVVGAVYYFHPLVRARRLSERLGRIAFWLMFVGFNVTFLPMHFTGMRGMPRRVFTYEADLGFDLLNLVSTAGAVLLVIGFAVVLWDVLRPKGGQPVVARNPWGAGTLEWLAEMPQRSWGVRSIPEIDSRYPLWDQPDLVRHVDEGRFYLPDAEELRRETIVTTPIDARPIQCLRVPGPTWITLYAASFTGGAFFLATFHLWWLAGISSVLALGAILVWLWTGTAVIPEKPEKAIGLGLTLPLYASGPKSIGWWAMLLSMLGDLTAFAGIVFGYYFFWTVHAEFPPPDAPGIPLGWSLAALGLALLAWAATLLARRANVRDRPAALYGALVLAGACGLGATAAFLWTPLAAGLDPTAHAYPAIVWLLVAWTALHVALGVLMQAYCIARRLAGRMTARHDIDMQNVALYWHFVALTAAVTIGTIVGFPALL